MRLVIYVGQTRSFARPFMHIMNISGRGSKLNAFLIISLGPRRRIVRRSTDMP